MSWIFLDVFGNFEYPNNSYFK